jgi:DNA-binding response OmpR family regulator
MEPATPISQERVAYCDVHLLIDFQHRTVTLDSGQLDFTAKEYDLLAFLVERAGQVVPRESLLYSVWGYNDQIRTRTLDVHLARVRKKLGPLGHQYIETVFGAGCRFQPQIGRAAAAGILNVA